MSLTFHCVNVMYVRVYMSMFNPLYNTFVAIEFDD